MTETEQTLLLMLCATVLIALGIALGDD